MEEKEMVRSIFLIEDGRRIGNPSQREMTQPHICSGRKLVRIDQNKTKVSFNH